MFVQPISANPDRLADNLALHERSNARRRKDIERAAGVSGPAIAAARSEKERQLLTQIFETIPRILELSGLHDLAEIYAKGEDLAERRWQKALRQLEGKLIKLINLPAEDAGAAHRRLMLNLEVRKMVELITPTSDLDDMFQEDVCIIAEAAMKALKSLANPAPTGSERIWTKALERYQAAEAASKSPDLTDEEWDEATDKANDLEEALHQTPSPSIVALAEKMRLTLRFVLEDYVPDSVDDPRTIAVGLAQRDCTVKEQVLAYQDALRLAGMRPEIVATTAFDPAPFVDAAEAVGISLSVVENPDGRLMIAPFLRPDSRGEGLSPELSAALDDLHDGELAIIKAYLYDRAREALH